MPFVEAKWSFLVFRTASELVVRYCCRSPLRQSGQGIRLVALQELGGYKHLMTIV